jgi:hypothetical protein
MKAVLGNQFNNVRLVYEKVLLYKQKHFQICFCVYESRYKCKALLHAQADKSFQCENLAHGYTKAKFHHLLFFTLILGPFLPEFLGS